MSPVTTVNSSICEFTSCFIELQTLQTCAMIVKYQFSVKLSPAYLYMTVLEITTEC